MNDAARPKALVTGATCDIGAAYVDRLARLGHDIVLVAEDGELLRTVAERARRDPGVAAEAMRADLLDEAGLARVEKRLRDDAAITVLVNHARRPRPARADAPDAGNNASRDVLALARLAGVAVRAFLPRGGGTIVNVGSVAALMPETFEPGYAASQAYLLALTQSLHHQFEPRGIRVQAVLAGITEALPWACDDQEAAMPSRAAARQARELVDAALAGLDMGEAVSIPSLADLDHWERFDGARCGLGPFLSGRHAAERYRLARTQDLR